MTTVSHLPIKARPLLAIMAAAGLFWAAMLWIRPGTSTGCQQGERDADAADDAYSSYAPAGTAPSSGTTAHSATRIQVISDIHMEIEGTTERLPYFPRRAPILALVGDIGNPMLPGYESFLLTQADRFDTVLVVAGNHEYYQLLDLQSRRRTGMRTIPWGMPVPYEDIRDRMAEICAKRPNLVLMNMTRHVLRVRDGRLRKGAVRGGVAATAAAADDDDDDGGDDRIVVLGTTLWSRLAGPWRDQAEVFSNDYRNIFSRNPAVQFGSARGSPWPTRNVSAWTRKRAAEVAAREAEMRRQGIDDRFHISASTTNGWHSQEVAWLKRELAAAEQQGLPVVVLTHHAPTPVDTIEDIDDPATRAVTEILDSTPLEELVAAPPVEAWIFAHTHKNRDVLLPRRRSATTAAGSKKASKGGTRGGSGGSGGGGGDGTGDRTVRLVSNQLGYVKFGTELSDFRTDFVVTVGGTG